MTHADISTAEQLWIRAHELVRRGEFAAAVRDLARCYELLAQHNDPRVPEVHRRWIEVHQLYVEDGARGAPPVVVHAASLEAQAESRANAGDLAGAVALYEQGVAAQPHNELVRERLDELRVRFQQRPRSRTVVLLTHAKMDSMRVLL